MEGGNQRTPVDAERLQVKLPARILNVLASGEQGTSYTLSTMHWMTGRQKIFILVAENERGFQKYSICLNLVLHSIFSMLIKLLNYISIAGILTSVM